MSESRRKTIGAISLALGLVALIFILILTAVHAVGTDGALYYALQQRAWESYDIASPAGVSDVDLRDLDDRLAAYLAGDYDALRADVETYGVYPVVETEVYGELQPAFNQKEMTHLTDCYNLFALLRKVRKRLIPWAVLLTVGGVYLLEYDRRRIRKIAWLSPLILLIPLGAFAVWAAVDFDGAFTFFHRLLFTNDLWLLDPATDLLIRICPQSMFMAMGLRIALWGLAALLSVPAMMTALTFIMPKIDKDEDNQWNENRATRRASAQRPKTFDFGERR
ncbi:MAG: DUF1461 domain-containing protein [Clostridia bacterium]|nr:DUF1461 domain-containing protein [Clostridia bacterium]